MIQQISEAQYEQAMVKVAIGIHVIQTICKQVNASDTKKNQCIHNWCNILSSGLRIPINSIITDGIQISAELPSEFVNSQQFKIITMDMMNHLQRVNAIPNKN